MQVHMVGTQSFAVHADLAEAFCVCDRDLDWDASERKHVFTDATRRTDAEGLARRQCVLDYMFEKDSEQLGAGGCGPTCGRTCAGLLVSLGGDRTLVFHPLRPRMRIDGHRPPRPMIWRGGAVNEGVGFHRDRGCS